MHTHLAITALGLAATTLVSAQVGVSGSSTPTTANYTSAQIADGTAFNDVNQMALENMKANIDSRNNTFCTYENADVRQEWREMDQATRKSFTDAATCLMTLPPQRMTNAEASDYPGVKSRHDEYVATHINYTYNIHDTADFFAWHRTFVHFYEQDLRNQCGYTGHAPYWNWAMDAAAPQDNAMFNGDEYSLGSNGEFIPNRTDTYLALQQISYPPGTGGGCLTSGPFSGSNTTVHLGPLDLPNTNNVNSSFEYNPHCLIRDLNPFFSTRYTSWTNLTDALLDNSRIEDEQSDVQGYLNNNHFGVHGGGHWQGGGAVTDFHSSPADPLFFLHHGMIDRVYVIWQNLDIYRRQTAISGTSTLGNSPATPEMTLDDLVPFGFVAASQRLGDLMDTFAGPFCYRYD